MDGYPRGERGCEGPAPIPGPAVCGRCLRLGLGAGFSQALGEYGLRLVLDSPILLAGSALTEAGPCPEEGGILIPCGETLLHSG